LQSCHSDAVVANGPAHGLGFTWLTADREQALDDGASLNRWLNAKLAR